MTTSFETTTKNEILLAVLAQMPDGIMIADNNDKIIFVNQAAEEIKQVLADGLIGLHALECHPEEYHNKIKRALRFLKKEDSKAFTRTLKSEDTNKDYENSYVPIRDEFGHYIATSVILKDITDATKHNEEKTARIQDLENKVADLTEELHGLFISSMGSLINTLEARDPYTKGHSLRVYNIAAKLPEYRSGISQNSREIELAGKLHDIGKVGVREMVLNKPGKLTDKEFDHLKEHPVIGEKILTPIQQLNSVARIVRHHHERFDGSGYPDGLSGEEIPEGSRILAIADSFDAMTSVRPYRSAMPPEIAAKEIEDNLGTQFDSEWGEVFLELYHAGSID